MNVEAFYKISYGLYIVTLQIMARWRGRLPTPSFRLQANR